MSFSSDTVMSMLPRSLVRHRDAGAHRIVEIVRVVRGRLATTTLVDAELPVIMRERNTEIAQRLFRERDRPKAASPFHRTLLIELSSSGTLAHLRAMASRG